MRVVMDGYVRVSKTGDREGEEYRSPTIQREEIERWAKANDVEVGKILIDEDVSGSTPVGKRKLGRLIERVEGGLSEGIIVYRADRFGRDHAETLVAAKRIKDAGGRLVGVQDGLDSSQPAGKWVLNFMSLQAEDYLDRVKANWKASAVRAVQEGKHIACRAPLGYLRADEDDPQYDSGGKLIRDARLVVNPETAPSVAMAFEMRATGKTYTAIADYLEGQLGRVFTKSTVCSMFKNRAYLGEARGGGGGEVKAGAHVAIVEEGVFDRAQPTKRGYVPRNGTLAEQALLGSLVHCAACGHKMSVMGTTSKKTGERFANYVCKGRFSEGHCPAKAIINVAKLDGFVMERFQDDERDLKSARADAERRYLIAKETVAKAEGDLDSWIEDPTYRETLSKDRYKAGLVSRQEAVDQAKRDMWDAEEDGTMEEGDVLFPDSDEPIVYSLWGEDKARDRRLLKRYIKRVEVSKPDPKRRKYQPTEERVNIYWTGADTPA